MADVIITPASGLIDFQNTVGVSSASIQLDGNGNLIIGAAAGDIQIGDTSSDIFVGDGVNNVDIVFEQDGEIRGESGVTVTLGQSDSFIAFAGDITGTVDFTGVATFSGGQTWASDITWNTGENIFVDGESSFDVRSGGSWSVWDGSTSGNWIQASYGQPLLLNNNALTTIVNTSSGADYFQIRHRTDTDINMVFYCESQTAQIADTFADTTTDKKFISFSGPNNSNDAGFIMHETSNSETNEGVLHLCPSDDNAEGDYVSIHGSNDADQLRLHTNSLIESVNSQLTLKSGSNQVYVNDDLYISGGIYDGTSLGTNGQILSSTGIGITWIDGGNVGAAGTWAYNNVGVHTTKLVGVNTSTIAGAANSEGALQVYGNVTILDGALLTDQNIDTNVYIPSGKNGLMIGPTTVGVGITIDVASGSTLVVV